MSTWKGIILSGGSGTRLAPLTKAISKQLLPVYDKPMVYYPLSTLIQIGIKDIAIITAPDQQHLFQNLLSDGKQLGCNFEYFVQEKPAGLAEAFIITEQFIKNSPTCLILGDNIFYGNGLITQAKKAMTKSEGATVFGYRVNDPERYGVVEFDETNKAISIEEKPSKPKSPYAIPGLYFYDQQVIRIAKSLTPSQRGELEITDINKSYLTNNKLQVEVIERGVAWLDAGTFESLLQASSFIHAVQERQGLMIGSPEESAWASGFIGDEQLKVLADSQKKNAYGQYLLNLIGKKNADN